MNKILFILLISVTYSNADYLHTTNNNICVSGVTPYSGNTGWCYVSSVDGLTYCDDTLSLSSLYDGYIDNNGSCILKNDLAFTGLTQNQFNYLLALLAHALGFTMFLLINYLAIIVARGK